MRVLCLTAATVALLAIPMPVVLTAQQWWWPFGGSEPSDEVTLLLLETQELRSEKEQLDRENLRLQTLNETLNENLSELREILAGQEPELQNLLLEKERLSGELSRSRADAAAERARAEELERGLRAMPPPESSSWWWFVGAAALAVGWWREHSQVRLLKAKTAGSTTVVMDVTPTGKKVGP